MATTPYFLDTSFVLAVLNTRDQWHSKAVYLQEKIETAKQTLITTEFVLTEIADGLSTVKFRELGAAAIRSLIDDKLVTVVPASPNLFRAALNLFESRKDKTWGLTDCSSFIVMTDLGITDALTTDDDFRQAGFNALMLQLSIN